MSTLNKHLNKEIIKNIVWWYSVMEVRDRQCPHLCNSGLFLLELTESEDPCSGLIIELLLEWMEQLHLFSKTGHRHTRKQNQLWCLNCGSLFLGSIISPGLDCLTLCMCYLTCTQTPVPPPIVWGHWWLPIGIQKPAVLQKQDIAAVYLDTLRHIKETSVLTLGGVTWHGW